MPKITPARPDAHAPHAEPLEPAAGGWCLPCYEVGSYTLAADPSLSLCVVHAQNGRSAIGAGGSTALSNRSRRRSRPPRGRAARPPAGPSGRPWVGRLTAARARLRGMAYGRRRAAARVVAGRYDPHPGWRHLIEPQYRVLVDQAEALVVVDELVDAQEWRSDKRGAWWAILRRLVCSMDWQTGLVTAVTLARLGDAGGRAPRTVSRVIAWARDAGLLVVVEHGASAEFLGTDQGRTPTYVLVAPLTSPEPAAVSPSSVDVPSTQLSMVVDESGDLPVSHVEHQPLNGRRLERAAPAPATWPVYGVPQSAPERAAATRYLFQRLGLDQRGVSGVPLWRARALLRPWWDAGACPAALLHAIDHHPDRPDHHRGDALRGARDPVRVLGARLRPWQDRLHELPAKLAGLPGDYRAWPVRQSPAPAVPAAAPLPRERSAAQLAALAAWKAHRAQLRAARAAAGRPSFGDHGPR